jgi:hypothetical protein
LLEGNELIRLKATGNVKRKPPPKLRPQSPAQELPPEMSAKEMGEKKEKSGVLLAGSERWQ